MFRYGRGCGSIESAATAVGCAAGVVAFGGDAADVFGEAVGVVVDEVEGESAVVFLDGVEGEVGEAGVVVLDLDGEGIGGEDGGAVFEDGGELVALDAVVDVGGDPDLEEAFTFGADLAAAVDEFLFDEADFGDVEVRRDFLAVGELEGDGFSGVGGEGGFEVGDGHGGEVIGDQLSVMRRNV